MEVLLVLCLLCQCEPNGCPLLFGARVPINGARDDECLIMA